MVWCGVRCDVSIREWWGMEGSHGQGRQGSKGPTLASVHGKPQTVRTTGVIQSDTVVFSSCEKRKNRPENVREEFG